MEATVLISFGFFLQVTIEQRIYHGCFYKNASGTNNIFKTGDKCLVPTGECFWRDPCDVKHGVKTSSRAKIEPMVTLKDFNRYYDEKLVDF